MQGEYKITGATIARTVVLIIAIINQALTAAGKPILPFEEATVSELVSTLFLIVTSVVTFWFNNSYTKAALKGDAVMKEERLAAKETKKTEGQ